jgi:hypothetical protein
MIRGSKAHEHDRQAQRIEAVRTLEQAGYIFIAGAWVGPALGAASTIAPLTANADAMHALLVLRADALMGCPEESEGAAELALITDTIERYEASRWPDGKVPAGKG